MGIHSWDRIPIPPFQFCVGGDLSHTTVNAIQTDGGVQRTSVRESGVRGFEQEGTGGMLGHSSRWQQSVSGAGGSPTGASERAGQVRAPVGQTAAGNRSIAAGQVIVHS
ncbi:hypothetical protein MHYP_G00293730 [Metynnis hypsauchen]